MKRIAFIVSVWVAPSLSSDAEVFFLVVRAAPDTAQADQAGYSIVLLPSEGDLLSGVATIPSTPADSYFRVPQTVILRLFDATKREIARVPMAAHEINESSRAEFSLHRDLLANSFISVAYGDVHGNTHFTQIVLGSFPVQTPNK